ncbi:Cyanobacterial phytochrome B [Psilocybe cubensis]|uniref:Cyanobacterial phytochrome B n=1 Tax=Psilocybe cubensis TaxID=181762 RepID=A0ACB8GY94_PSICU|nr:Cyanobacterial phytochrome B [Psilocybe cubensis]KAH9480564.1 Cyanobacterial phytochrome B [Psilocybe cubensis]
MDNNAPDRKIQSQPPRLSSTSYVYPVKSLLEGRIQPALPESSVSSRPKFSTSQSSDAIVDLPNEHRDRSARIGAEKSAIWARDVHRSFGDRTSATSDIAVDEFTEVDQALLMKRDKDKSNRPRSNSTSSIPSPARSIEKGKLKEVTTANVGQDKLRKSPERYSYTLQEDSPYFPRTFSSLNIPIQHTDIQDASAFVNLESSMISTAHVLGHRAPERHSPRSITTSSINSPPRVHQNWNPRDISTPTDKMSFNTQRFNAEDNVTEAVSTDPHHIQPSVSEDSISHETCNYDQLDTPVTLHPASTRPEQIVNDEASTLTFNPSLFGIVHLPPLPSSSSPSGRGSFSSSPAKSGSRGLDFGLVNNALRSSGRSVNGSNSTLSHSGKEPSHTMESANISSNPSIQDTDFHSSLETKSTTHSEDPHVSVRFRTMQDEHGNHVVIGREGNVTRCEDEPIHTPGAVQAFGVLIALDEVEDTLVVRQVSENSTELLGLPPKFLFDLECFTDTLPDTQAGVLWDNIDFLNDPSLRSDDDECSPQVFQLRGWGAPGSGHSQEFETEDGKRLWTCWCAIHRSAATQSSDKSTGLIVIEFELEKDVLNPLYPPISLPPSSASDSPQPSSQTGSESIRGEHMSPDPESDQSTAGQPSSKYASSTPSMLSTYLESGRDPTLPQSLHGLNGDDEWMPSAEDIIRSTTSQSRPLPALERLRRMTRSAVSFGNSVHGNPPKRRRGTKSRGGSSAGVMDVFAVMSQINEQLGAAPDLNTFLNVVVGVIKDLTQFHRVMIYQFDELWNGQVVAELVDWAQSHDLFRGLHFPASDIPAQARKLYAINKVRLLYDCAQHTARIVARDQADIDNPLDMTHCYLRAMSPIHITYLQNMGVRASMSISLMAFGQLWGLVTCHSYGSSGMRVSFPVRQMLRLLSQSISKNIERLSYAQRLHTRKLINTVSSPNHPTGYIVSNADDLLALFDADFGILVIGEGAKLLGPNQHGQEILIMAEYLRLKQFETIQASQAVVADYPDLELTTGFEVIAGLLYVPLSSGGKDFIALLRKGQPRQVHWAGKPFKEGEGGSTSLEPRKSFKIWSETIAGRSKAWTDDQLDTAGVLALVYGKFIEVWREKENAVNATKLTNLLLTNASHEEMAMNSPLDKETHDNLQKSHAASKSLLFTINDLLDLTRLESGTETSFNEAFDLRTAIQEATLIYRKEAKRRNLQFILDLAESPTMVIGDIKKIRTVVQNLTANALKFTTEGCITVSCKTFGEPEGLRNVDQIAVEILVSDTGCGISASRLESIFRQFEHVEPSQPKSNGDPGVGLGLAVVSRIVEQLGGQLRVDSEAGIGSKFSFLIPLSLSTGGQSMASSKSDGTSRSSNSLKISPVGSRSGSLFTESAGRDIEFMVNALSSNHMTSPRGTSANSLDDRENSEQLQRPGLGRRNSSQVIFTLSGPRSPSLLPPAGNVEYDRKTVEVISPLPTPRGDDTPSSSTTDVASPPLPLHHRLEHVSLKVLIVEDNDINRIILAKRLSLSGHKVINSTDGREGLNKVISDPTFDLVLMDIQMPIMNGFESTASIRKFEQEINLAQTTQCQSQILNGRIPIFAVSASLREQQREELLHHGMDGWILKPIDFARLNEILKGITDPNQRHKDVYKPGCSWESGGWLKRHS